MSLQYLSLGFGRGVSVSILITSMSGSKSLKDFCLPLLPLQETGLGLAFNAAERNERFGRIQC